VSAAQILLAWVISHPGVMAIPKAASVEHVAQNAAALTITLTVQELAQLDNAFPAPGKKSRSIWCKERYSPKHWRLVDENQGSVVIISLKIKEKGDLHD
jgi:diketogulonate reductase-like aldo/keto reductase